MTIKLKLFKIMIITEIVVDKNKQNRKISVSLLLICMKYPSKENEKKEKLDTDKDSGSDSKKSKNKFLNEIYKQKNKILSLFSIFSIIFLNLLLSYRKSDEEKHSKENKLIQNSKSFSEIIEKKFEEIKEENKDIIRFNKSLNQLEFQGLSIQLKNQIRDFFKKNIDELKKLVKIQILKNDFAFALSLSTLIEIQNLILVQLSEDFSAD